MFLQLFQRLVERLHGAHIAAGFQQPDAEFEFIVAQRQDGIVELARHRQRPPRRAQRENAFDVRRQLAIGRGDGKGCGAGLAIEFHRDMPVAIAGCVNFALEAGQRYSLLGRLPIAYGAQRSGARCNRFAELLRLRDMVYQPPLLGPLGAHALGHGAEQVRMIAPDLALVGKPGEAAGSGQYAQQRHFRQAHGRGAVVDHQDFIAGERELVAAASRGAVQRREEFQARMPARVLDAVARLIGEFAEIDFPRMRRQTQHVDVGAGAEHALLGAGDHDGFHFRVFEADALQRVVQFDIDTEIIRVEFELVSRLHSAVFGDVHGKRRDRPFERKPPMAVSFG